jgi:hypothetical protein
LLGVDSQTLYFAVKIGVVFNHGASSFLLYG